MIELPSQSHHKLGTTPIDSSQLPLAFNVIQQVRVNSGIAPEQLGV